MITSVACRLSSYALTNWKINLNHIIFKLLRSSPVPQGNLPCMILTLIFRAFGVPLEPCSPVPLCIYIRK